MDKNDIVYRLFDSDVANALTNEAAREIDRLRVELETTKRHMVEDTRAIGALEDEVAALRVELAKTQEENNILQSQVDNATATWEQQKICTDRERKAKEAAEARIKELELALSGKTFSYDPDSYKDGMIAGLDKIKNTTLGFIKEWVGEGDQGERENHAYRRVALVADLCIEEVKNESK